MFWKKEKKEESAAIQWHVLNSIDQLDTIIEESSETPIMIYKHSTRCGISGMTLNRLERSWSDDLNSIKTYYLDLIAYRDISNEIAARFGVYHESPQVLIIKGGQSVYDASHMEINTESLIAYK